ncbi:hypothetical protein CKA32_006382 [Geitlerinema sp. FC II]|nr:hypothetical protein CKA32_006382 [Geitlerinema sp. FC II]
MCHKIETKRESGTGNGERGTGNQIFSGVLIFDDSFGTSIFLFDRAKHKTKYF